MAKKTKRIRICPIRFAEFHRVLTVEISAFAYSRLLESQTMSQEEAGPFS